jgi:hypothetical protein
LTKEEEMTATIIVDNIKIRRRHPTMCRRFGTSTRSAKAKAKHEHQRCSALDAA